jgi:hypothetical protein
MHKKGKNPGLFCVIYLCIKQTVFAHYFLVDTFFYSSLTFEATTCFGCILNQPSSGGDKTKELVHRSFYLLIQNTAKKKVSSEECEENERAERRDWRFVLIKTLGMRGEPFYRPPPPSKEQPQHIKTKPTQKVT